MGLFWKRSYQNRKGWIRQRYKSLFILLAKVPKISDSFVEVSTNPMKTARLRNNLQKERN